MGSNAMDPLVDPPGAYGTLRAEGNSCDLSYFDLKKPEKVRRLIWTAVLAAFSGSAGAVQLARALILTRLWLNTPCPHQMEAPWRPSSRVRSQPYPRLR
jgi:hypothetical protein